MQQFKESQELKNLVLFFFAHTLVMIYLFHMHIAASANAQNLTLVRVVQELLKNFCFNNSIFKTGFMIASSYVFSSIVPLVG